jgi:hypothetical protein
VDVLVEDSAENFRRVIAALSELEDRTAAELTPEDFVENVVVKIADEVQVDVSRQAWQVIYGDAAATAEELTIDGVRVPFVGLETMIQSKFHLPAGAEAPTGEWVKLAAGFRIAVSRRSESTSGPMRQELPRLVFLDRADVSAGFPPSQC